MLPSRPIRLTLKRLFPDYDSHRAAFEARLDQTIAESTAMLLRALNPPDSPPNVSKIDLPDPIEARDAALATWDENVARIWTEWNTLPQRFTPQRQAMEETLLRRFASILNQTRQSALGIDQYIWTTAGDNKVRSSHAARNGQTFDWDSGAIHPGSEPNCRCIAVPVLPDMPNVVLTQTPSGTATPPRPVTPIGALLSVLSQLLANGRLTPDNRAAAEAEIAALYGLDLDTDRGRLAAELYLSALEANQGGLLANPDEARIAAEAAALYALTYGETPPATAPTPNAFIDGALDAYRERNLTLQDETFADGWTEVLPALTDGERRLGQLEGFTAEQMDEFIEFYPLEDLGLLPASTGGSAPPALDDGVVDTPIPELELGIFLNVPNPHRGNDIIITEERAGHILDGDPDNIRGGGHRYGTGRPRKTEFPETWTDQRILYAIREVATGVDVALESTREPGQVYIEGVVDGVEIRVVVSSDGRVLSAYPLEGPLVTRNPR